MEYLLHICILALIYVILALSLNLQVGYTGLYNFGHVAFFGIGAYTSALLTLAGVPVSLGMTAAMVMAAAVGYVIAYPVLRLTGDFFGIATLAFGEMTRLFFLNERWLTKGPMGLPGIPRPGFMGAGPEALPWFLAFALVLAVCAHLFLHRLTASPFGRALKVIREDEYVAKAFGKDVVSFKVRAVVVGSAWAGLAGAVWAHYVTYISPNDFTLQTTILILLGVVLGGKGTARGPVLGAILVIFFQELLRFMPIPAGWNRFVAPLQGMVFGLVLIVLMLKRPQGLIREHKT